MKVEIVGLPTLIAGCIYSEMNMKVEIIGLPALISGDKSLRDDLTEEIFKMIWNDFGVSSAGIEVTFPTGEPRTQGTADVYVSANFEIDHDMIAQVVATPIIHLCKDRAIRSPTRFVSAMH